MASFDQAISISIQHLGSTPLVPDLGFIIIMHYKLTHLLVTTCCYAC